MPEDDSSNPPKPGRALRETGIIAGLLGILIIIGIVELYSHPVKITSSYLSYTHNVSGCNQTKIDFSLSGFFGVPISDTGRGGYIIQVSTDVGQV